ncbi:MAG: Ig-like domain-containing protein, partial [Clostridia bacterium]
DPWLMSDTGAGGSFSWGEVVYGCNLSGPVGGWASLKIRVPADGVYTANLLHAKWYLGMNVETYLAPDVPGINTMDGTYLLGTVETNTDIPPEEKGYFEWDVTTPLRNVALKAGDYVLTFKRAPATEHPAGCQETRGSVEGISLVPAKTEELYLRTSNIDKLSPGRTVSAELVADVNGTAKGFSGAVCSAVSQDESVATGAVRIEGEKAYLDVNAVSIGDTKIKVSATIDGKKAEYLVSISVKDPNELSSVDFTIAKANLAVNEQSQTTLKATTAGGVEVDMTTAGRYYMSSNAEAATVDKDGLVTAHTAGSAEITAYLTYGKATVSRKVGIYVTDTTAVESININPLTDITVGGTAQLSTTGVLGSGLTTPIAASNVTYELVVDPASAGVIDLTPAGLVTANSAGVVNVVATATIGGNTLKSEPMKITVSNGVAYDMNFDFRKLALNKTPVRDIAIGIKYDWMMDKANSNTNAVNNVKYATFDDYGISAIVDSCDDTKESDFALNFRVPGTGTYSLDFSGVKTPLGTIANIYIDNNYVGQYSFREGEAIKNI